MEKQIVVYPYNEILLINKKEWVTDTENMAESPNNCAKQKKADKKVHAVWPIYVNCRKCQLIYSDRKHIIGFLGTRQEGEIKRTRRTFGLMDMFAVFIVVMVSWVIHMSKIIKSYTLNMTYSLLYVT